MIYVLTFSFGTGPAGLLSPLHLDSHRRHGGNPEFARHVYIKEETDPLDTASHHLLMQQQLPLSSQQQQQQQELERIAQAETPPAVSNVELASTMIASLIGEQRTSSPSPQNYSVCVPQSSTSMMQHRIANIKRDTEDSLEGRSNGDDAELEMQRQQYSQKGAFHSVRTTRGKSCSFYLFKLKLKICLILKNEEIEASKVLKLIIYV
ncbi:unnamed protein product [Strongylus vulgaris]|uniref:Uncharacterized protein n=1 Tax=Strongylus vulgaris TaxID=40348 RepID=A0A3P7IL59_STRVU|nr:unnamed protein product [Strongylus vulgaris]